MKKETIFLLALSMITLFFVSSCEEEDPNGHEFITFINSSETDIYIIQKNEYNIIPVDTFYKCYFGWHKIVNANSSKEFGGGYDSWELEFKYSPCIQFYIFSDITPLHDCNKDSIQSYTEKYLLKRYEMTKEKMEKANWIITYP